MEVINMSFEGITLVNDLGENFNISEMWVGSTLVFRMQPKEEWPYETLRISRDGGVTWEDYGRPVEIEMFQFAEMGITHVELPDSVTSIGDCAFGYNQLTSVVIPDSLTSIGIIAFSNNQLTSVTIPDSVTSIGIIAFDGNPLEEVSIGPNTAYELSSFPDSAIITVRDE